MADLRDLLERMAGSYYGQNLIVAELRDGIPSDPVVALSCLLRLRAAFGRGAGDSPELLSQLEFIAKTCRLLDGYTRGSIDTNDLMRAVAALGRYPTAELMFIMFDCTYALGFVGAPPEDPSRTERIDVLDMAIETQHRLSGYWHAILR